MSAIWGIIDLSQRELKADSKSAFEAQYCKYAIHRMESKTVSNAIFGCAHQFLTPTAANEALPYHDPKHSMLFTCDAVLDNRNELLADFPNMSPDTPDGTLIYQAYRKWGLEVCDHLLGAFAFAVYHQDTNECYLFTDHMGNRSLFYYCKDHVLYFSTLIAPLQSITQSALSDKWITTYLSNTSANIALVESLTPFEEVHQCLNATYTLFTPKGITSKTYWSPLTIKPNLSLPSEKDYRNLFVQTIKDCVHSQINTIGQTGCTLSGGLDSTTVAAFAAIATAADDKTLYSYTSVPLKDFKEVSDSYAIIDESQRVLDFCKLYSNIKPNFLSCPGKDGFTPVSRFTPLLGYPLKSGHNLTWLNEIYETARKDGCTLMLKGQFGNSTISYGPALSVFYQLLLSGKWKTLYRCIRSFQDNYHVPMKHIFKLILKEWCNNHKKIPFNYEDSLAPRSHLKEHDVPKILHRMQRLTGMGNMDSRSQRMHFMYDRAALGQLGMFDTAMGLIHGILIRDPSKDKRVVELCARMPVRYYIAGGLERGLIRTFMQGYIPSSILLDIHHRGLQSADNHYRISQNWPLYKESVSAILKSDLLHPYVDTEISQRLLEEIESTDNLSPYATRQLNIIYTLATFLKVFGGEP